MIEPEICTQNGHNHSSDSGEQPLVALLASTLLIGHQEDSFRSVNLSGGALAWLSLWSEACRLLAKITVEGPLVQKLELNKRVYKRQTDRQTNASR